MRASYAELTISRCGAPTFDDCHFHFAARDPGGSQLSAVFPAEAAEPLAWRLAVKVPTELLVKAALDELRPCGQRLREEGWPAELFVEAASEALR